MKSEAEQAAGGKRRQRSSLNSDFHPAAATAITLAQKMKTIFLSIISFCVCGLADEENNRFSSQDAKRDLEIEALHLDIHLVVLATTNRIENGDEVDLDVYGVNDSSQSIDCPSSADLDHDGYSDTSTTLYSNCFRLERQELVSFGSGQDARPLMDRAKSSIARHTSKHYKFKWKCSSEDFDVITLEVELFIGGKFRRGTVTFLPKRQQGVAPQSATRSESDSEGGDKPQKESDPRPR